VHPVEVADRQDGVGEWFFNFFDIFDQYHAMMSGGAAPALNFGLTENVKNFS
jgi:hypothetical protein